MLDELQTSRLSDQALLRYQVEDFLYAECELLDAWALPEWYGLFTEDCVYQITTPGMDDPEGANPDVDLFLVADDNERLRQRTIRLGKKTAYVESPRSTLSHLISNVRVFREADGTVGVRARFIVHRSRGDAIVHFFGHVHYRLRPQGETFRIVAKRCILDFDSLTYRGKLAILL
jgi:p-cumate 2,3-dioxygenase beta subunit